MTNGKGTVRTPVPKVDPKVGKLVNYASHPVYVDLSKLRKSSLKWYNKHFNLDLKAGSKKKLLGAVGKHFVTIPESEVKVVLQCANFLPSSKQRNGVADVAAAVNMTMNVSSTSNVTANVTSHIIVGNNGRQSLPASSVNTNVIANPANLSNLSKSSLLMSSASQNKNQDILAINYAPTSFRPTHKNVAHHHTLLYISDAFL